ncbi:MAG: hypothetical protein WCG85_11810, partial [Polyangia bacterium]
MRWRFGALEPGREADSNSVTTRGNRAPIGNLLRWPTLTDGGFMIRPLPFAYAALGLAVMASQSV